MGGRDAEKNGTEPEVSNPFKSFETEALKKIYEISLKRTEETGDKAAQGILLCETGNGYRRIGDFKQAIYYHELHLKLSKEVGNRAGEGSAYGNLGNAYCSLGNFKKAKHYYELCLRTAKGVGSRAMEVGACGNLGICCHSLGDFKKAIQYRELQLKVSREDGNRVEEGNAYCGLGNGYLSIGDLQKAIHYHELYLEVSKQMGNREGEASAYNNLGSDYHILGDFKKAINYHELCLKIAHELGDKAEQGRAYGNLGCDYQSLGDYKKAIYYHERHLEIAKQVGNRAEEGTAYGNLGKGYCNLGDFRKAIHFHESYLEIAKEVDDRVGEGNAYGFLGNDYGSLGDFQKAIHYHELHLEISKQVGNRVGEGAANGNLGNIYQRVGDFKKSIHYHELSLLISKEVGNMAGQGGAFGNLGNDYQSLGDFKKAIRYHELQLKIAKQVGNRALEGTAYGNLGNSYQSLEDFKRAIHYHELGLKIAKEVGDRAREGETYGNLGNDHFDLGDHDKSIHYHRLHLEIAKEVGDRAREGSAYNNLGNAYGVLGDFQKSIHYFELQLKIAKDVGNRAGEGAAYNNLGWTFESQGSLSLAVSYYESSVSVLNDIRARLHRHDEWKISLRDLYQTVYTRLWCVLVKQFKVTDALLAAEQGRSQALKDLMERKYGYEISDVDSLTTDEALLDALGNLPSSIFTVFLAANRQQLVSWVIQKGKVLNVDTRSEQFSDNQLCDFTTFLHSLLKNAFDDIGVGAGLKCEDRSLGEIKDQNLENKRSDQTQSCPLHIQSSALRSLYDIIIGPIANFIDGNELIIVPDGPLWLAPYAAFMDSNSKYLSESFRLRMVPSLTCLAFFAECAADRHHKSGALLVGDPWVQDVVFPDGQKLEQLPFAKKEVEMIGGILKTTPLTGTEATKNEVLKRLASVALVHIAAHGRMETGEIALSPYPSQASQTPKDEDFLLKIADVLRVDLRARLVVLSCCHSGRGEVKAEGVVGIARAFLGAGARSVLVSLWAIDDKATLQFMKYFYQHFVKGRRASEAMNQAMKSMRESEEFNKVKYWAPFVLIGDDVTLEFDGSDQTS